MPAFIKSGVIHPNPAPIDLLLYPDSSLESLAPHIQQSHVIAIEFPQFSDGRGYSLARLLREQYQYKGELRAIGNVLYDQIYFMTRCGFDSLLIYDNELERIGGESIVLKALSELSLGYQHGLDSTPVLRKLRRLN